MSTVCVSSTLYAIVCAVSFISSHHFLFAMCICVKEYKGYPFQRNALDLQLSISDVFFKTKIYEKRDDFDFDIAIFPFLDGDVPRSTSYGV